MGTTAFDTKTPLNLKGGLALLVKDLAKMPMQEVPPGGNSLFAGILGQKISQAALLGSASDPTTAEHGGPPLLPADTKSVILNGNGEPATGGKAKRTADHHPLLSTDNNEPFIGIAGESDPHADPSPTENASRQIAPQYGPAATLFAQALRPQETAAAISHEARPLSDHHADHRSPREGAEHRTEPAFMQRAVEPLHLKSDSPATDGAPAKNPTAAAPADAATSISHLARPLSDHHADHRSPREGAEHRTEPAFMQRAVEPLHLKSDSPATDGAPAKNPTAAAPADAATSISHLARPLSDHHADHRSPREGAEHRTEPAFMQRAVEPLHLESDGPATDGAPAKNRTAATPADAATSISHEARPLTDRHADHRSPREGAEHRTEPAFIQRAVEPLHLKSDGPATDGALDVRQASPSHQNHWKRAGESKEGASITAAPQKPISAAGNGDATIAQAQSERMTPGGPPDQTLPGRDAATETTGPARDYQQSRNTTSNHQMRLSERDMFAFRMELPNVASQQQTLPPATVGSTGIEMQAVIDQILEARQGVGNDFGRIRILLNPPNLGTVDLDIVVRGEKVEVVMTAENATVQQALQSRADDIRIALQRQDLKIETFHVLLQDNTANQQQANSGAAFEQHRGQWVRQTNPEDSTPIQPLTRSAGESGTAQGLVSIFV